MITTIYLKGVEQVVWVYPSLTIIFYLLPANIAAMIGSWFIGVVMVMVYPQSDSMDLLKFSVSAIATFLFCYAFAARMRKHADALSALATTDPLTGVGNRRALEEKLLDITSRLSRYPNQMCSLVLLDLDHFKAINDEHGHDVGDEVLRQFAKLLTQRIRTNDQVFRYGGEEFVIVLEQTAILEAVKLSMSLGHEVSKAEWQINDLNVTVSSGIAQCLSEESARDWISRADIALYKAKANGRNCCFADDMNSEQLIQHAKERGVEDPNVQ